MPRAGTADALKYDTRRHGRARREALARFRPGDPCAICHQPMHPGQHTRRCPPDCKRTHLDLDHQPGTNRYRGLAHEYCNRADGGRRGAYATRRTRETRRTWRSRDW